MPNINASRNLDSTLFAEGLEVSELNRVIDETYGHLTPDEIGNLEAEYEVTTTQMLQVIQLGPQSAWMEDIYDEKEFQPVIFPEAIRALLDIRDVFLMTIGRRGRRWHVLYMGPLYVEELYEFDFSGE